MVSELESQTIKESLRKSSIFKKSMDFERRLKKSKVRELQSQPIFGVGWATDAWGGSILLRETEFEGLSELRRSLCTLKSKCNFFHNF